LEFVETTQIYFEDLAQVCEANVLFNGISRAEQEKSDMRREVNSILEEIAYI
jgi:hypothetical protein